MPDATISSTASTFGTISGTFAADQSTVTGTITAITGSVDGSVGVPGPQGIQGIQGIQGDPGSPGAPGQGVAAGGSTGQVLQKLSATSYDTGWLTLPADYITSVSAPLAVASGVLSVDLSTYLLKSGGYITGDIQSSNNSAYRSWDGVYNTAILKADYLQLGNSNIGGNTLTVEWDGITFADGKQTVKFPGAATLFANAALTGNPTAPTPDTSDNDTSIATTAFVKAQGYLTSAPVTSVAGKVGVVTLDNTDISGLGSLAVVNDAPSDGSQYARKNGAWDVVSASAFITSVSSPLAVATGNLTVDLSAYLTTSAAASTYYLQTNPDGFITSAALTGYATETFVTTQGYITQATADGLYYPLSGNPSGFLTSVPPPTLTNLTSDISWDGSANIGRLLISGVNDIGGGFTEGRLNFQSGVPNSPTTGDFWYNGTDFFYQSGGVKTIASQTYVNAQGFITSSALTPYAPLSSPTFTGTPTLPTGTIATTQSPGNNTTALATTAFVTAAVPAIATAQQAITGTSATVALSPSSIGAQLTRGFTQRFDFISTTSTSGSGQVTTAFSGFREAYVSATASAGRASFSLGSVGGAGSLGGYSDERKIDYSKKIWVAGRASTNYSATYVGDANTSVSCALGGFNTNTVGDMNVAGIGWRKAGGSGAFVTLMVHNGTTFTTVATTKTVATLELFDWLIYSDGTGNVTLYINGVSSATTSAGPTGLGGANQNIYREQCEKTAVATQMLLHSYGGCYYSER